MERDSALRVGQKLVIPTAESIRNSANTPDKTTSHSTKSTTKSTSSKSNRYGWPVKGDVIRRYSSNFKGLEISCNKSSFINAVADGEVIFSDVMDGYGKIVIIDHLNGIFTIYARLRSILVSNGDSIKNGQKVGRGGTPNDSGQTRMYFEFRKAKHEGDDPTPVDPMEYLR
jgi:septal ring factor EnvC (AmiA/AmiB activator)